MTTALVYTFLFLLNSITINVFQIKLEFKTLYDTPKKYMTHIRTVPQRVRQTKTCRPMGLHHASVRKPYKIYLHMYVGNFEIRLIYL